MKPTNFVIKWSTIELIKLLKAAGVVDSGAEAKQLVDTKKVKVNGVVELRKRAQLKPGDVVNFGEYYITIGSI